MVGYQCDGTRYAVRANCHGSIRTQPFRTKKDLRRLASKQFQCQHTQPIYNKGGTRKEYLFLLFMLPNSSLMHRDSPCCNVLPMLSTGILIWPPLLVCGVADVSFVVYSSTILLPLSKHPINLSTCCWLLISGKKSRRCFPVGKSLVAEAMKEELPVPAFFFCFELFLFTHFCRFAR